MDIANITFSGIQILPPPPIYTFGTIPSSIDEGNSGTFNVITYNEVPDGTTLYWTINHGTTASADFSASSGSFTVTGYLGSFSITALADILTEGSQTFTVQIRTGSTSGTVVATSSSVTINDTSTAPPATTAQFLVVAGGGAGGSRYNAGGGGAGGLLVGTTSISSGKSYTITVGAGGSVTYDVNTIGNNGGVNYRGNNSVLSGSGLTTQTAIGGGGGGSYQTASGGNQSGGAGGSGGGASGYGRTDADKGTPTSGQGNYGGRGAKVGGAEGGGYSGAGGGGAGGVGTNGAASKGGDGGGGILWTDGNWYAGGGGGAVYCPSYSTSKIKGYGGIGGGGDGEQLTSTSHPSTDPSTSGAANTGGGGGGVSGYYLQQRQPGDGGSGIVVIRYADSYPAATGTTGSPTYTVSGGFRTYRFTSSGTISF